MALLHTALQYISLSLAVLWCNGLYTVLYSGVLWCTVVCCGVLWCTVVYCAILWCTVVYCGVLWCTVVYCAIMWCTVVYYTPLLHRGQGQGYSCDRRSSSN